MTCHFDPVLNAFVALCQPVLSVLNRSKVIENDPNCFITTHKMDLRLIGMQGALTELLMLNARSTNLYEIISHESLEIVSKRHQESKNKRKIRFSKKKSELIEFYSKLWTRKAREAQQITLKCYSKTAAQLTACLICLWTRINRFVVFFN